MHPKHTYRKILFILTRSSGTFSEIDLGLQLEITVLLLGLQWEIDLGLQIGLQWVLQQLSVGD
jgi:hypothetical protein